jgi:hypothetical protein
MSKGENMPLGLYQRPIKKAYDSVRREVLYSILIEFGVPMKLTLKCV